MLNDNVLEKWEEFQKLERKIKENYLLRMKCDRFIMVVDKNTNEYINLYKKDFEGKFDYLDYISDILDKHINYN